MSGPVEISMSGMPRRSRRKVVVSGSSLMRRALSSSTIIVGMVTSPFLVCIFPL